MLLLNLTVLCKKKTNKAVYTNFVPFLIILAQSNCCNSFITSLLLYSSITPIMKTANAMERPTEKATYWVAGDKTVPKRHDSGVGETKTVIS